ncbi:type II secretion system protein GspD [Halanaerobium sp. ST460_2HS_T2]|uniref:type II secretion system protein GspD n=1 Tax=Halanaerobium sp. ST460_2HS_T2 TaxID=2183914 RepID=UPI000DF4253B|nr:type II and III secretion system protein [Halanaerobium sp. ST460_2HS_T2]RCW61167.1 type IV pilus assembly protein PilQ [Halanaerobium sp. ST460_2HS_T2]
MKSKVQKVFQISIILVIILLVSAFVKAEKGSENNLISINLRDVELETALIMLANTADKNLICDSSVKGKITVIFNDIPFENALNLITDSFNLDYSYQKQIIYISTREKMAARNQKFVSKSYKFNNLSSELAAEILRNNFEEIKIINLNSEGLIINCKEKNLKELEKIISQIDQPQKQIMIKARIEEISRTKIKELGINPNQLAELKIIKNDSGNIEKLKPGWPETLKALNEKGLSNILANPSLMTLDRKKAKLVIGDQIPVKLERIESDKTVSTISYIEAGIVLEFLPKIINQNQILLEIKPSVNSIGQILADGLPAVNSRSAETTVILEDGETLAIGGLIKKDELKTVKEIPILADLPLLGSLFSAAKNTDIETELIIFITPEIIESEVRIVQNKITESNNNEINKKINSQKEEIKGEKQNKNNREFKTLTEEELKEILN